MGIARVREFPGIFGHVWARKGAKRHEKARKGTNGNNRAQMGTFGYGLGNYLRGDYEGDTGGLGRDPKGVGS